MIFDINSDIKFHVKLDVKFDIDKEKSLSERLKITRKMEAEFPDKIPIILQQYNYNITKTKKNYYLLLQNKSDTMDEIKKNLKEKKTIDYTHILVKINDNVYSYEKIIDINFYINKKFIHDNINFEKLYHINKDEDGLLKLWFMEPIAEELLFDYPNHIPIIIKLKSECEEKIILNNNNNLNKTCKYIKPFTCIFPNNKNIEDLEYFIKDYFNVEEPFYIVSIIKKTYYIPLIENPIQYLFISPKENIMDVYNEYENDDGFLELFIHYTLL
jgi:hypothetical protein